MTAADAAAGVANFDLTWTEYPVDEAGVRTGESAESTVTGSLPVEQSDPVDPTEEPTEEPTSTRLCRSNSFELVQKWVLNNMVRFS